MIEKEFYSATIIESSESPFSSVHQIKEQLEDKVKFTVIRSKVYSDTFAHLYLKVLEIQSDLLIICYDDSHDEIIDFIVKIKEEEPLLPILVISSKPDPDVIASILKYPNVDFSSLQKFSAEKFYHSLLFFRKEHKHHYLLDLLKTENKKLWQIVKQNPVSILITDAKSNSIEFVNYNFTKLTGYSLYEVLGKDPKILASGNMPKEIYRIMWATLNVGKVWKGDIQNKKKDGSYFWCHTAIAPLFNEKGVLTHYVAIYEDITDKIIAQNKLREYTLELKKKSEELEKANEHLNKNMERALKLHKHFFPSAMPIIEDYRLEAYYQPAEIIGGDFYNVIKYKDQLLFYIVDASGKGIDGAFINIFVRQKINRYLYIEKEGVGILHPKEILEFLAKEYILENFPSEYFICLFVGVLNLQNHELIYSNAGIQIPPIICGANEAHILNVGGLPISSAIDIDLLQYESEQIIFPEEATFVVTSDGMVEEYESGEIYGIDRFRNVIKDYYYLPPTLLKEQLVNKVKEFLNGKKNEDDHTFLIIQRNFKKLYSKEFLLNSSIEEIQIMGNEIYKLLIKYKVPNHDLVLFGIYEMVYNALEHGNKFDITKKIYTKLDIFDSHAKIVIEDEGKGFNWREKINRTIDLLDESERGRGIILTKKCFSSIHYNEKGNKVRLFAKIK